MIITNALTSCVYIIFGKVYKYINIKPFSISLMIEMLQYSSPIVITQIACGLILQIDT